MNNTHKPRLIHLIAFILPLVVLLCSALGNIVTSARVSDLGAKIHALEVKHETLSMQNQAVTAQLAQKQSLSHLREVALAQGFVPITHVVNVKPSTSLAQAINQ